MEQEQYTQMTLTDWWAIKADIRRKLEETAENFVYIGCKLKEIEKSESYKQDGAADIYEFAEKEYGLHRSTTQRFMAINTKFSIEGNSTELIPEFKQFGSSKLQEMLTLSDEDCKLLTPKTTVKEIRDLKAFNKQDPEAEEAEQTAEVQEVKYTPLQKCIIDYFSKPEKRETLNAVLKMYFDSDTSEEITRQQVALINPSDFQTHTKGIIYLFMYEFNKGVACKKVTESSPTKMDWVEFIEAIAEIYHSSYGPDTWVNYYGPVPQTIEPQKVEKKEEKKAAEKPINTKSSCATSHTVKEVQEPEKTEEVEEEDEEEDTETEQEELDGQAEEETTEEAADKTEEADNELGNTQENGTETILDNPYYKLQEQAVQMAEKIAHLVKLHYHVTIEDDMMRRIKAEVSNLAAVVEQLAEMGESQ